MSRNSTERRILGTQSWQSIFPNKYIIFLKDVFVPNQEVPVSNFKDCLIRESHSNLTETIIILLFSRYIAFKRNHHISVEVKSGGEKNCQAEAFYYTQKHKMQLIQKPILFRMLNEKSHNTPNKSWDKDSNWSKELAFIIHYNILFKNK